MQACTHTYINAYTTFPVLYNNSKKKDSDGCNRTIGNKHNLVGRYIYISCSNLIKKRIAHCICNSYRDGSVFDFIDGKRSNWAFIQCVDTDRIGGIGISVGIYGRESKIINGCMF